MKSTLIILLIFITAFIIPSAIAVNRVLSSDGDVVSIEGTLLMLDDRTPHVAVPVQAIRNGKIMATALSDEGGKYRFINLKPGRCQVRCCTLEGYIYYRSNQRRKKSEKGNAKSLSPLMRGVKEEVLQVELGKTLKNIDFHFAPFKKGTWKTYTFLDGLGDNVVNAIYCDPDGVIWFGTRGGVSQYDGKEFVNFTTKDGLAHNDVLAIHGDPDGIIWFGTRGGISRYDGKTFVNFTTKDGLASNTVSSIYRDPGGILWFGTGYVDVAGGGVSRYDGKEFANFTTEDGLLTNTVLSIYRAPNGAMWFGARWGGVSRYNGKEFVNFTTKDGLAHNEIGAIHSDLDGALWFGTDGGGASRYDGKEFVNFTTKDGLANRVWDIYRDFDGVMWFGTSEGVARYNGKEFVNFTTKDGLAHNYVNIIYQTPDGVMWFGTDSGVSQYDEKGFLNLTTEDGLAHNAVRVIYCDPDGVLWFGTDGSGVSRYDGKTFVNLTTEDGLVDNRVLSIHHASDGALWFGTRGGASRYDGKEFKNVTTKDGLPYHEFPYVSTICCAFDDAIWFGTARGVSRYDGKTFVNFTTEDGLAHNWVHVICQTPDGVMWFGTQVGVSHYDGKDFKNFTEKDGLAHNVILSIYRDPDGALWFGTSGGVSRYDGKTFVNFTVEYGLAGNEVRSIHRDVDGMMWFGTTSGGVSRYDGTTWTSLDTRDGLAGNSVWSIHQNEDRSLWFATDGGVTRYRPSATKPKVRIVLVKTDRESADTHEGLSLQAIPPITTGRRVTIKYSAIDFKTVPEKRQYWYRIKELDDDWRRPTRETAFDDFFDKPGEYTFEVQAIDRDLNYSEPASVKLKVVPPFYMTAGFLIPTVGLGTILMLVSIISATAYFKHRRRVRAYERAAAEELQDAREMQMSLMPQTAPPIEGIEIAGRCMSANTVGGDFFDYLQSERLNEIGLVVADVTGKGLKGAMNAVMTDGILRTTVMEQEQFSPASLLMTVNNVLKDSMEQYMNVTMVIGMLDVETKTLTLANAAHHAHPLLLRLGLSRNEVTYRNQGDIQTLKAGGLPLGMRANAEYTEEQFTLQTGDVLILMTDGIIEAQDSEERYYSESGRLERVIREFTLDLSAEAMVDAIIADVLDFGGDKATRDDDMTVVVAKVL